MAGSVLLLVSAASDLGLIGGGAFATAPLDVAVIVSDTFGRPWREGQTDVAIGIAGMDRLVRFNVLAMSGRAVEAAGDVDTLLALDWNNGNRTQQVMLWAVDNHEPEAYFPEPRITILANMNSLMTILLRGNSVLLDTDPQLKDEALLIGLAGELIRAQLGAGRGAGA
mgnify:CR=1 FL=1